ncbi:MAG: hypothetical protein H6581_14565 [Bacteroidia bacterium]|nr:hypothetical protein [Bacteroidia bacterium]
MRKLFGLFLTFFLLSLSLYAQVPQAINYQAVARDPQGSALINTNIGIRISILSGSSTGPVEYAETHTVTSNQFGLMNLRVGNGFPVMGTFANVNWSNANQWMKVDMDPNGGTNYITMGTAPLVSVPFALYADSAGSVAMGLGDLVDVDLTGLQPGQVLQYNGTMWVPSSGPNFYYPGSGIAIINDTIHNILWDTLGLDIFRDWGNVGIGTNNIHPSALVHLESKKRGFLPPRMTTVQRDSISGPAEGLIIYNTQDSTLQYWNGVCWLPVNMDDCNACDFNFSLTSVSGIINRTTSDSAVTQIVVNQTNGVQPIGLFLISNLPQGVTTTLTNPTINGSGIATLTVHASIFATPGTYPIAIQGICGSLIKNLIYTVKIDTCYQVNIIQNKTGYDLQAAAGLPGPGTPICVVVKVFPGINIVSDSTNIPAFTSGGLDTNSHVGIWNDGAFLAKGGDGGAGGSFQTFGQPGGDGGDAIHLTTRTTIQNNGVIFAGGGGGGSAAIEILSIPFLGSISVGAGGGGGARLGKGGDDGFIPLPIFDDGIDGTDGVIGVGGAGGTLSIPISFSISAVTITITPTGNGGHGGNYGEPGTSGNVYVNVQVAVPFLGTIFNQNFPNPPVSSFPPGGQPGMSVKRFNHTLIGLFDGNYLTPFIKGAIGP